MAWIKADTEIKTATPGGISTAWVRADSAIATVEPGLAEAWVEADSRLATIEPGVAVDGWVEVDSKTAIVSPPAIPPPEMSGVIIDLRFFSKDWQTKPPSVDRGSIIGVRAIGRNTGDALASMTMNAVIEDPDGERIATATKTIDWVATDQEMEIECKTIDTDKEGNYTAYIELIGRDAGAYALDSWEGKIATVGKPFPWKWLGIGTGTLGLIILAKPKKKT